MWPTPAIAILTGMPDTPAPELSYLAGLGRIGRPVSYSKGAAIFHLGDPGSFVLILADGLIEVSVLSQSGRKSVLAWVGPNEVLGEISALDGGPRSADAIAVEACRGVVVTRAALLSHLHDTPEAATEVIAALCRRIRNASDGVARHALTSASARLADCLLRLARDWGTPAADGGVTLSRTFSQANLGAFAGIARENVSRQIASMAKSGFVTHSAGVLTIHDLSALESLRDDARV
ncbi:Crp/Fnr family transcriptional regulator [Litorisediminicola beolgyonensis]|uniref:Crp/Fnr family transcriptional regulator n=1 Tax=Litorisediminicola beolgyonensis TaxID=1173614 RepID=A0ABW3ZJN7_9RHOB